MSIVIAALILVGLLCSLDLLLTVGVIKRLREHTELLSRKGDQASLTTGEEVGSFSARTVDGEAVTDEMIDTETVVAFFSTTCGPCKEKLPKFVEYARSVPGGRGRVIATVVGEGDESAPMVAALSPVARVTAEDASGVMGEAFKVMAYPVVLKVNRTTDGRLLVMADQVDVDRPAVASV
ncbi:hypothetical protein AB0F13_17615 [Streptomyces sp. NPDC026206]|uniref:hypothetical protein n=1 Tax=Streptomyces sp. NPDC026206 TaxID=3157089 RepID=UPI0033E4FA29